MLFTSPFSVASSLGRDFSARLRFNENLALSFERDFLARL